ncbi:MAG: translation elongation factor-like protein [Candidatus Omnitrophica bacterium]|nr:translation elongation factor-like protein [Candidatus Omnitrophota bacterium]
MKKQIVGEVTHYFSKVKAAVIKIKKGPVNAGDIIYIKGHTTDFKQKISSMQIDRKLVDKAAKGKEVGVRVKRRVRVGDVVYKNITGKAVKR